MKNKTGLGRGLGALIDTENISTNGSSSISEVELDLIFANPNQPRSHFDEEALTELAVSIRELGVISPITLRKNDNGTYLIIAGERRFRASKLIGLKTIPAYVKTAADEQVMEMALIENIQREDLNAIEIALTFYRLMEEYKLTQEKLSDRVGKKRTTIANYLRHIITNNGLNHQYFFIIQIIFFKNIRLSKKNKISYSKNRQAKILLFFVP